MYSSQNLDFPELNACKAFINQVISGTTLQADSLTWALALESVAQEFRQTAHNRLQGSLQTIESSFIEGEIQDNE